MRNVIAACVVVLALVFVANFFLKIGTHHGQEIEVPDFTNMSVSDASYLASDRGIRIDVTDSVYVRKMGRGLVFSQVPKAGSHVKTGRRILLTINSVSPKKTTMPDLVGFSMRQAKAELLSKGLILRKLRYVEDIATNNVLRQLIAAMISRRARPLTAVLKSTLLSVSVLMTRLLCRMLRV